MSEKNCNMLIGGKHCGCSRDIVVRVGVSGTGAVPVNLCRHHRNVEDEILTHLAIMKGKPQNQIPNRPIRDADISIGTIVQRSNGGTARICNVAGTNITLKFGANRRYGCTVAHLKAHYKIAGYSY